MHFISCTFSFKTSEVLIGNMALEQGPMHFLMPTVITLLDSES